MAEQTCAESEELFLAVLQHSPDLIFFKDRKLRYTCVNPEMERLLGISRASAIGKTDRDLFGEEVARHEGATDRRALEGETIEEDYERIVAGNAVWFCVKKVPVRDNSGNIVGICGIAHHVSPSAKPRGVLANGWHNYRELVELLPQIVYELDINLNLTFANRNGLEIAGYTQNDLVSGLNAINLFVPEDRERLIRNIQRVLQGETSAGNEYTLVRKDGSRIPLVTYSSPIMHNGTIVGVRGIGVDITARKNAEQAFNTAREELERTMQERTALLEETTGELSREILVRSLAEKVARETEVRYRKLSEESKSREELYRSLLNSLADAVVVYDLDGKVRYVNDSFTRMFGWKLEEVHGRVMEHVPESEREQTQANIDRIMQSGVPLSGFETKRYTRDRKILDCGVSGSCYRDHEGNIAGLLVILSDITRRKEAEKGLEQALASAKQLRAEAETANAAKSEFLANMSHELRTPLNAIIGFSEILHDQTFGALNDRQVKYISYVLNSGRHLLHLINDILDLAKVESGKMDMKVSRVKVRQLLENSLVMITERAREHSLRLDLVIGEALAGLEVQADEVKLKQIMFNLLSNAAKFTRAQGSIRVSADRNGDEILVSVSDSGIGIRQGDLDRVFGAFEQAQSGSGPRQQGTGLGLALTRQLVALHGGRIWAESEGEGKGSTFTVAIPIVQID